MLLFNIFLHFPFYNFAYYLSLFHYLYFFLLYKYLLAHVVFLAPFNPFLFWVFSRFFFSVITKNYFILLKLNITFAVGPKTASETRSVIDVRNVMLNITKMPVLPQDIIGMRDTMIWLPSKWWFLYKESSFFFFFACFNPYFKNFHSFANPHNIGQVSELDLRLSDNGLNRIYFDIIGRNRFKKEWWTGKSSENYCRVEILVELFFPYLGGSQ